MMLAQGVQLLLSAAPSTIQWYIAQHMVKHNARHCALQFLTGPIYLFPAATPGTKNLRITNFKVYLQNQKQKENGSKRHGNDTFQVL